MPAKTIFLVDDQDLVRKTLVRCVKRFRPDDTLVDFSSPSDLLKAALEGRWPDLVITDRDMPELTGERLASDLKRAGFAGPVIMITGNAEILVPPAHVDDLVKKPFEMKELSETISRHLDPP